MRIKPMKHFLMSTLFVVSAVNANDSLNSEISHLIGGAVMAGGITAVVDRYYPEYREDRGWVGFGLSSAAIIAFESVTVALNGDVHGQLLDVAYHVTGSALGAFVTDQYLLSPVIQNSSSEGKYIGVTLQHTF
ncbi:hypothetical protein [Sulfuricurvum sp.]|uniref:hypothetical protein n=1 Tax=Sulfuricurvum sp. TaxID=2025608 RepID=UPI003C3B922C